MDGICSTITFNLFIALKVTGFLFSAVLLQAIIRNKTLLGRVE